MDDYKELSGYGVRVKTHKPKVSEKGHREEWIALYDALVNGTSPIDVNSLLETTRLSFLAAEE